MSLALPRASSVRLFRLFPYEPPIDLNSMAMTSCFRETTSKSHFLVER